MNPFRPKLLNNGDILNLLEAGLVHGHIGRRSFMKLALAAGASLATTQASAESLGDAAITQRYNSRNLQKSYDYIVVGSGSGGAVVAGRLAAESNAQVLLLEAGGTDQLEQVLNPRLWTNTIRTPLEWGFTAEPNPKVNGRSLILPMGKVVGGGSSINAMIWARGHKSDFDFWAAETGNDAWNYKSVLEIYKRIEDWHGAPDPERRGKGGPVYVDRVRGENPVASAFVDACGTVGIPGYEDMNGKMMEGEGGAALANVRIRDGRRLNMASAYLWENLKRSNLTLLTGATVHSLEMNGTTVTGLSFEKNGELHTISAKTRVILSAGAINTPKILMLSGIGRSQDLKRLGIDVRHDLQGVGQNFQDHILAAGCIWEYKRPLPAANSGAEATFFWKSNSSLDAPDMQPFHEEMPYASEVTSTQYKVPPDSWSIAPGIVRPMSRGQVTLKSKDPTVPPTIDGGFLRDDRDLKAMLHCIELCREIGNSAPLSEYVKREVMPGTLSREALTDFARNATSTYFHESCTCKMGKDDMSVVDGNLSVYGINNLSIADASVMPRVTLGNTMAPTVVIGERMADYVLKLGN